jgi:DNA adenine methylase
VAAYPLRETVLDAARLLRRANFQCADFESVCETVVRGDFVYLDPPYYIPARRVFREYSSLPFSEADFQRLRKTLHSIDKKGGKFLLSYPECSLALNLASEWSRRRITVRRTIAGNALSTRPRNSRL